MQKDLSLMINFFWYGDISEIQKLCWNSFLKFHDSINIWSYDKIQGYENFCKDANQIISQDKFFYSNNPWGNVKKKELITPFADIFRYKLLNDVGGWYVDSDMICLKKLPNINGTYLNSEYNENKQRILINSVLYSNDTNNIFGKMYHDIIEYPNYNKQTRLKFCDDDFLKKYQITNSFEPIFSNPLQWFEVEKIIYDDLEFNKKTYMVHLFNVIWKFGLWSEDSIKKISLKTYEKNSFYDRIKKEYL